MTPVRRRTVLGLLPLGVAATSGCSALVGGCSDHDTVRIHTSRMTNEGHREHADPIEVSDLPSEERDVLSSAIGDGRYVECYPGSDAMQSLIDRILAHRVVHREQALNYAVYRDEWYELDVYLRDELVTDE